MSEVQQVPALTHYLAICKSINIYKAYFPNQETQILNKEWLLLIVRVRNRLAEEVKILCFHQIWRSVLPEMFAARKGPRDKKALITWKLWCNRVRRAFQARSNSIPWHYTGTQFPCIFSYLHYSSSYLYIGSWVTSSFMFWLERKVVKSRSTIFT